MEYDVVAQFLQPAHEAFLRVVTISLITVIAPQLFIALVLVQSSYPICAILLNLFQNKQDRQVRFPGSPPLLVNSRSLAATDLVRTGRTT